MSVSIAKFRATYGYDILINTFERRLRDFVANQIFLPQYGDNWKNYVPTGVINELSQFKQIDPGNTVSIDDFFEELSFLNLKDIIVAGQHYKLAQPFLGDELSKDKFIELMDSLNIYRRKIAHAKSTFSQLDLLAVIDQIKMVCQGEKSHSIVLYLDNESYKNAHEIPATFYEEYGIPNNLPPETYDLDGGFVGRVKEINNIKAHINSNQDRIITITGAGGVGKSAIALKVAYSFLSDSGAQFEAIIWFSAKANKLTEGGIISIKPEIRNQAQFMEDILELIDHNTLQSFKKAGVTADSYISYLSDFFTAHKCLLVVDNLETILKDNQLIEFIKNIPRPTQVLITSRKGLGEIERRIPIADLPEKDALSLFRLIAKERNRQDLLRLKDVTILQLVKRVRCYPLLIKWAIGQVCLGQPIDKAFSQIFEKDSEIAKFVFNDVFDLLSGDSLSILYSMAVYGDKPITRGLLMHLADLEDENFDDAIKELTITSFIFSENEDSQSKPVTEYSMLELTRGFVESKLNTDEKTNHMLVTRLHDLSRQMDEIEKSSSTYFQSLTSIGIKTPDEQIAYNYVKAAKNFYAQGNTENAEKNFELALQIAPYLAYVPIEYSKFEMAREHFAPAIELAESAVRTDENNFHAWFNLGIIFSRNQNFTDAITCFQKCKELNPKYLQAYTELGRAYSFSKEYEKAETEFLAALKEEKFPNYRHQLFTYQCLAESYRHHAENFRGRSDLDGELKMLNKALFAISKAIQINPTERYVRKIYHRICTDLGIAFTKKEGFAVGRPYLEKCLTPDTVNGVKIMPDQRVMLNAYIFLSALSVGKNVVTDEQIGQWIEKGLLCSPSEKESQRLNDLKFRLKVSAKSPEIRISGKIKFYNIERSFGIIDSENSSYIFFLNGFRDKHPPEVLNNINGKTVSFVSNNQKRPGKDPVAYDIAIE